MVRRERGRRAFLRGTAGLGAGGPLAAADGPRLGDRPPLGASGVGVPGLDDRHEVRWTFDAGADEATVYPVVRTEGTVATLVKTVREAGPTYAVHAFDARTGDGRWTRELDGPASFPKAADGRVYVVDGDDLVALDAADGSDRWRVERDGVDLRDVALGDRSVFVVRDARVTAVDAVHGDERWTTEVRNDGRLRAPTVADGRVYFGGDLGFYALDQEAGREQWFSEVPDGETTWVGGVRDRLLVGWSDAAVYGLRAVDGTRRWRTPKRPLQPYGSVGALDADAVYLWGTTLTAVDLSTGEERWTFGTDGGRGYAPTVHAGSVYFPVSGGDFVAVDADSGRERWRFDAGTLHGYWGGAADGLVYVVGDGEAHVLDAGSGRERWTLDLGDETGLWADVSDDAAFVATRGGTLYAVDRPSPLATAPVSTVGEFATSPPGLGLLGLLAAGLLTTGYWQLERRGRDRDGDPEFGRLDRLGGGPVTETYRKRVRTPDGPRLVAETRLTDDADAETRRAFADAVERWADLDADGVLPVREHDPDADAPRFETPYVPGGSLADSWPVARRDRIEVASGVARTLHDAHREGVAHGHLAPRHVFPVLETTDGERPPRTPGGDVLVGGWFVEAALADASDPYAPPESPSDDAGVGGDVYRAAALAYHLLAGDVPAPDPEPASSRNPALPAELDAVLSRALAADPGERHGTALGFDDEFRWAAIPR